MYHKLIVKNKLFNTQNYSIINLELLNVFGKAQELFPTVHKIFIFKKSKTAQKQYYDDH